VSRPPVRTESGAISTGPDFRRRPRGVAILVAVLLLAVGTVLGARLVDRPAPGCQSAFVPAFFPPADWARVAADGHRPGVMILNPASGPGTTPDSNLQTAVADAMDSGTRVIAYIGTDYGQRPLAEAERYVRQYRKWYHPTGYFLDQSPTDGTARIGYYRTLRSYIHKLSPGAPIWLNPGVYPDRAYMSIGNVVMVFEGSYADYLRLKPPRWARHYHADRFAHTIYATRQSELDSAIQLSRTRKAGFVYITNDVTPNPYKALPNYWRQELPSVAGGCARPSQ
jgi:hypothetical protein